MTCHGRRGPADRRRAARRPRAAGRRAPFMVSMRYGRPGRAALLGRGRGPRRRRGAGPAAVGRPPGQRAPAGLAGRRPRGPRPRRPCWPAAGERRARPARRLVAAGDRPPALSRRPAGAGVRLRRVDPDRCAPAPSAAGRRGRRERRARGLPPRPGRLPRAGRCHRAGRKDAALLAIADALRGRTPSGSSPPTTSDLARGCADGMAPALLDRLRLDAARVAAVADALRAPGRAARPGRRGRARARLANGLRDPPGAGADGRGRRWSTRPGPT